MSLMSNAKQMIRPFYRAMRQKRLNDTYLKTYQKYAFDETGILTDEKQFEACITRLYHTIEKGLAFSDFRSGFGKRNLEKLLEQMKAYAAVYDTEAFFYRTALSCLQAYIKKNKEYGYEDPELEAQIRLLPGVPNDCGGVVDVRPLRSDERNAMDYASFVKSRHSIRHFSKEPVDTEKIKNAIRLAQHTPSACNRQGWKARIIADKEVLSQVLKNQNGNRGFGEEIDQMIVVTSDLRYFNQERELHQAFIDGGMYAQSIIQALHYEGIAMIPLSASLWEEQDKAVRKVLHIDEAEMLIMFIGVGNYPDACMTTRSERKPVEITLV